MQSHCQGKNCYTNFGHLLCKNRLCVAFFGYAKKEGTKTNTVAAAFLFGWPWLFGNQTVSDYSSKFLDYLTHPCLHGISAICQSNNWMWRVVKLYMQPAYQSTYMGSMPRDWCRRVPRMEYHKWPWMLFWRKRRSLKKRQSSPLKWLWCLRVLEGVKRQMFENYTSQW